jgi:hypothetical protein
MAARTLRKVFANPFVITLATACSAPQAPTQQVVPAPQAGETGGEPVVVTNPPAPKPEPSSGGEAQPAPPAQPQTYAFDQRWTVSKSGDKCVAMQRVECPKPTKAGGPMPTCNPPPPMKVACPDGWDGAAALTIVQYANQTECRVEDAPMKCPKGALCNPPPPRKVACPSFQ